MASEVWIALIAEDRCPLEVVSAAWNDVAAGGWMKLNRIVDVLSEVAAVGPLHSFHVAVLLEEYLTGTDPFPRDIAKLLELLDECNQRLGRSMPEPVRSVLAEFKSGKAKKLAKSLLDRKEIVTAERAAAIAASLAARIERAERNRIQAS